MKRFIASTLLLLASVSHADHLDVIGFTLNDNCSFDEYLEIVNDFNEWGDDYGYQAEIAAPMYHDDIDTHYWLGRSADVETFGKAYDAWAAAQSDSGSAPAQLNARFGDCTTNSTRRAYRTFP